MSDAELASLLSRQARSLADQLEADAVDLRNVDCSDPADQIDDVVEPLRRLAKVAESNQKPETRNA